MVYRCVAIVTCLCIRRMYRAASRVNVKNRARPTNKVRWLGALYLSRMIPSQEMADILYSIIKNNRCRVCILKSTIYIHTWESLHCIKQCSIERTILVPLSIHCVYMYIVCYSGRQQILYYTVYIAVFWLHSAQLWTFEIVRLWRHRATISNESCHLFVNSSSYAVYLLFTSPAFAHHDDF